jgi:preprotein translocase subunit YajC
LVWSVANQERFIAFTATLAIFRAPEAPEGPRAGTPRQSEFDSLFITPAFAQASAAASGPQDMLIQFAPFVVIFAIMYFLILRPQQRRAKEQREMVKGARRGDTIVTTGGLIGKVTKSTDDNEVEVEIAPNVRVRIARSGIGDVRARGEPVKDAPSKSA